MKGCCWRGEAVAGADVGGVGGGGGGGGGRR